MGLSKPIKQLKIHVYYSLICSNGRRGVRALPPVVLSMQLQAAPSSGVLASVILSKGHGGPESPYSYCSDRPTFPPRLALSNASCTFCIRWPDVCQILGECPPSHYRSDGPRYTSIVDILLVLVCRAVLRVPAAIDHRAQLVESVQACQISPLNQKSRRASFGSSLTDMGASPPFANGAAVSQFCSFAIRTFSFTADSFLAHSDREILLPEPRQRGQMAPPRTFGRNSPLPWQTGQSRYVSVMPPPQKDSRRAGIEPALNLTDKGHHGQLFTMPVRCFYCSVQWPRTGTIR